MSRIITETVAEVRKAGEIRALKERIDALSVEIGRSWSKTKNGDKFVRLTQAMDRGEAALAKMRELLAALQTLEPDNN